MIQQLDVWLHTFLTGTLSFEKGKLGFTYSPQWLASRDATPLSFSLPLQPAAFTEQVARPFFAGLLPEGQLRQLLSRQYRISGQNDFALLNEIGGECAGAVTFTAHGAALPENSADDTDIQWLDDDELVAVLEQLPKRPMLAGSEDIRLSLAGAQSKLPVVFDNGRMGIPKNNAPSTHIIKPAIAEAPGSVANEAFCMQLAAKLNLNVAAVQVYRLEQHEMLMVTRYDRTASKTSKPQRIHQEDFCQAMAVAPETKYQNEGGPNLPDCFELVRASTKPSAPQTLKLLDAVFFNALVGNHDAHAKNFSLLYSADKPVLAPLYDILSTAIYPEFTPKMAMKIGGKYEFEQVLPRHWGQFATEVGLNEGLMLKRLQTLAATLPAAASELQQQSNDWLESQAVSRVVDVIGSRCKQTLSRFAL